LLLLGRLCAERGKERHRGRAVRASTSPSLRLRPGTGGTVICNAAGTWASAGALIGVYNVLAYGTLQWGHRTD